MGKKAAPTVKPRILTREEYPPEILAPQGMYTPDVKFVAIHPMGTYHVEDQGASHHMAYFTPRRKGSRVRLVGGAGNLRGALAHIQNHEDELVNPDAPREMGRSGPVNVFSLGRRIGSGKKTPTDLDREIDEYLRIHAE